MVKYGETFKDFDEKWIIIDRDIEHTKGKGHTINNFKGAIEKARAKSVEVAYSNPSFELWYLLHYEYRNTPIDRDEVKSLVNKRLGGYEKSDEGMFQKLLPRQDTAIRNANKCYSCFNSKNSYPDPANDNPCTTVFKLVEKLNKLVN